MEKPWLDAGCGTGDNVICFAEAFPTMRFKGIDISAKSIQLAQANARTRHLGNVVFERQDLMEFSPAEAYDFVASLGVLHHTPSPERCLENLVRALRPGGHCFIDVYGYYGFLRMHTIREAINILEPNFDRMENRLNTMEWIIPHFLGTRPPERGDNRYIGLVDEYLSPIAFNYKAGEAIALLERAGIREVGWYDCPKLEEASIQYETFRGEKFNIDVPPPILERLRELPRITQYRFFELCFRPFDLFLAGRKGE